jgi:hypothetical protein
MSWDSCSYVFQMRGARSAPYNRYVSRYQVDFEKATFRPIDAFQSERFRRGTRDDEELVMVLNAEDTDGNKIQVLRQSNSRATTTEVRTIDQATFGVIVGDWLFVDHMDGTHSYTRALDPQDTFRPIGAPNETSYTRGQIERLPLLYREVSVPQAPQSAGPSTPARPFVYSEFLDIYRVGSNGIESVNRIPMMAKAAISRVIDGRIYTTSPEGSLVGISVEDPSDVVTAPMRGLVPKSQAFFWGDVVHFYIESSPRESVAFEIPSQRKLQPPDVESTLFRITPNKRFALYLDDPGFQKLTIVDRNDPSGKVRSISDLPDLNRVDVGITDQRLILYDRFRYTIYDLATGQKIAQRDLLWYVPWCLGLLLVGVLVWFRYWVLLSSQLAFPPLIDVFVLSLLLLMPWLLRIAADSTQVVGSKVIQFVGVYASILTALTTCWIWAAPSRLSRKIGIGGIVIALCYGAIGWGSLNAMTGELQRQRVTVIIGFFVFTICFAPFSRLRPQLVQPGREPQDRRERWRVTVSDFFWLSTAVALLFVCLPTASFRFTWNRFSNAELLLCICLSASAFLIGMVTLSRFSSLACFVSWIVTIFLIGEFLLVGRDVGMTRSWFSRPTAYEVFLTGMMSIPLGYLMCWPFRVRGWEYRRSLTL